MFLLFLALEGFSFSLVVIISLVLSSGSKVGASLDMCNAEELLVVIISLVFLLRSKIGALLDTCNAEKSMQK